MIQLFHVSKTYPPGRRALTDINLEISSGELVLIVGASGAGKSTLLKLLFREEELSEDWFANLFGEGRNAGGGRSQTIRMRGADVSYVAPVEFLEAALGAKKRLTLTDGKVRELIALSISANAFQWY